MTETDWLEQLDLSTAHIVQWCNSCNSQEAQHQIEVNFKHGFEQLLICHECLKILKKAGWL